MSQEPVRGSKRRFDSLDRSQEITSSQSQNPGTLITADLLKDQTVTEGPPSLPFLQPLSFTVQHGQSSLQTSSATISPSFAESRASRRLPLPSPISSSGYPSLPPFALSPEFEQYASYRQQTHANRDEIGLQAMQREYGNLTEVYHGSPTKSEEMDQNFDPTTSELLKAAKEIQRLQHRIQFLETHANDLKNGIEALQQHAAAKDAQYTQIIRHSTELESRGVVDSDRWKADREAWRLEKQVLDRMISALRSQIGTLPSSSSRDTRDPSSRVEEPGIDGNQNDLTISPLPLDPGNARQGNSSVGTGVAFESDELQLDFQQLAEYTAKLVDISQRIERRVAR